MLLLIFFAIIGRRHKTNFVRIALRRRLRVSIHYIYNGHIACPAPTPSPLFSSFLLGYVCNCVVGDVQYPYCTNSATWCIVHLVVSPLLLVLGTNG